MKERLKEKYLPIDYEQMMFEEMLQLRQGSLTVDQFTDRFHELTVRSKIMETEQQTLTCYRTGLREELRREMWIARLINVEEAYQLALRIEKQTKFSAGRRMTITEAKLEHTTANTFQRAPAQKDQNKSFGSWNSRGITKPTSEGPQCYKCKGYGHYAVVCPTRDNKLAFICEKELFTMEETEDTGTEDLDDDIHSEEEHLGALDLPSCVINRVLTGTKKEIQANPEWLRTSIFHTRMEHKDHALNVIIDNGRGINVISKTTVSCLGLKMEKHPSPYRINWVNDTNSILVKHRCLIKFSLGKTYVDKAWCDVIPMTICHMLLGHPWLYDRKVLYDGYTNTYSFSFKGKKFVLDPLHISKFETKQEVWLVLTMCQFTRVMHEDNMVLIWSHGKQSRKTVTHPLS